MAIKLPGCLKWMSLFALITAIAFYVAGEWYFNLSSNLVALSFRGSSQALEVRLRQGSWKSVGQLSVAELDGALADRHREEGFRWGSLTVRRPPTDPLQRVVQGLYGAEVNVLWVSPEKFDFHVSYLPKFALTTARERAGTENLWFCINANFRDQDGKPLGWVYHEGRRINPPFPLWTGCFFVKAGKPYFGPKSLLDEIPGTIEEGTQGYPSVMKNHTVFSYVDLAPDRFFDGKKIAYRSLAGTRRDGTVVFVVSGDGGVMNVSEVTELAKKLELQHATLFDGGRALQYSIRTSRNWWHFHAFNTSLNFTHPWLEAQKSPVYIGVRRKPPEIITTSP